MEDVAQVGEIGVVHIEHVKVLVGLGQVDGEALKNWVQVNIVIATAPNDAGTLSVHKALAGRKKVRGGT